MISPDDIAMAGEFVLGLLDAADMATASARIATDSEFATEAQAWRVRLQPMLDGPDHLPPEQIWAEISKAIGLSTGQDGVGGGSLRLWQGLTGISSIAAATLAVLLFTQQPTPVPVPAQPSAPLIAALGSETGNAALTASYDRDRAELLVTPVALDTGKLYPELWVIPVNGAPHSLGIVHNSKPTRVAITPDLQSFFDEGSTLAITPEPQTGGPGGKPSGPILASGKIISA